MVRSMTEALAVGSRSVAAGERTGTQTHQR
jgi:hypothetical protein